MKRTALTLILCAELCVPVVTLAQIVSDSNVAIEQLAETDPQAALDRLVENTDGASSSGLYAAARVWARTAPAAVVERMQQIQDPLKRESFITALLSQWSIEDTTAVLRYAATLEDWDLRVPESRPGARMNVRIDFPIRADSDMEEIFALAGDVPPNLSRVVRAGVIRRISATNPPLAASYLARIDEADRAGLVRNILREFVEFDRDAALAWVMSLENPDLLRDFFSYAASSDPHAAVDIAIELGDPAAVLTAAMAAVRSPSARPEAIIESVMSLPEANEGRGWLGSLMQAWAFADPRSALEWLVAQDGVDELVYRIVAGRLSAQPELAAEYANRVPPDMRGVWIEATVGMYARMDPASAQSWLGRYRGSSDYRTVAAAVARAMATSDPVAAAGLVENNDLWDDAGLVMQLARSWMNADIRAGARWAMSVPDADARRRAIMTAANSWLAYDPQEAELWAIGLPADDNRDQLLQWMIAGVIESDAELAGRLFVAIQADEVRELAALSAASRLVREDEAGARRLIERYVSSPELIEQFERYLEPVEVDRSCGLFRITC